jgi:hypothetical protein
MARKLPQFVAGNRSTPARPRTFYGGIVIGLAIFLVTLTVCRWQGDAFVAEAQMTLSRKSIDSVWPSTELWEEIMTRAVCTQLSSEKIHGEETPRQTIRMQAKSLNDHRISFRIDADSTPLFLNFSLLCVETRPELAIRSVNQLGNLLTQSELAINTAGISLADTNWHMVPAKIASRQSAPLSVGVIAVCLLVALLLTAPILTWHHRMSAIRNKSEIEAILQTPVLAHIAPSVDHPDCRKPHIFFRHLYTVGEWVLIAILLAAVATALLDKQFARQFIGQPVTALADGIRQLSEITRS